MAKRRKFWIKSAIDLSKKGRLRERLREVGAIGKADKPIPVKVLNKAAAGLWGPTTARRARLARTLRKLRR